MTRDLFRGRSAWVLVWGVPGAFLAAARLAAGDPAGAALQAGQFGLALALSLLLGRTRRLLVVTAGVLLSVMVLFGAIQVFMMSTSWHPRGGSVVESLRGHLAGTAVRRWKVPEAADAAELTFQTRLLAGRYGWEWYPMGHGIELAPLASPDDGAHAVFPDQGDPFLMRTYLVDGPLGGRIFRAKVELRSEALIPAAPCRGVWLQVWGEHGARACSMGSIGPEWTAQTVELAIPANTEARVLRLILNNLNGASVELRRAKVEEWTPHGWSILPTPAPAAPVVSFSRADGVRGWHTFEPESSWREIRVAVPVESATEPLELSMTTSPSGAVALEVRDTVLRVRSGEVWVKARTALPSLDRYSLGFPHPNLAAHSAVALTFVLVATGSGHLAAPALALLMALLLLTASRAALIGALAGLTLLGLWSLRRHPMPLRLWLPLVLALTLLISVPWIRDGPIERLLLRNVTNPTSRVEIWGVALSALRDHPWTGIGGGAEAFVAYWRERYGGQSKELVTHAHNLWLAYGAAYGIPGLAAMIWCTSTLVLTSGRLGGPLAVAGVTAVLVANLFDATLFFTWVLAGLLAAVHVAVPHSHVKPQRNLTEPPT